MDENKGIRAKVEHLFEEQLPNIRKLITEKMGSAARGAADNEEICKSVSTQIYKFLPFPMRLIINESVFNQICWNNRYILFQEERESGLDVISEEKGEQAKKSKEKTMLEKLREVKINAVDKIQETIYKERCILLPDKVINLILEKKLDTISKMAGAQISELKLTSNSEDLTLNGKATAKGVDAMFSLRVEPLLPIWTSDNHKVSFKVVENNLNIDKSKILGLLASVALAMVGILTGEDYFTSKIRGMSGEQGSIDIPLDNLDTRLDQVVKSLDLKRIVPRDGKVEIIFNLKEGGIMNFLEKNKD